MKKVFLVTRTDDWSYDEYDSCVIVAKDKEEVEEMIKLRRINYFDSGKHEIEEINLKDCESKELCASFNAG